MIVQAAIINRQSQFLWLIVISLFSIGCGVSDTFYAKNAIFMGDLDRAISRLNSAIEMNQTDVVAWRELGVAEYKLKNFDNAEIALEKAFELDRTSEKTALYFSMASEFNGDLQNAVKAIDQFILNSDNSHLKHLSALYRQKLVKNWHKKLVESVIDRSGKFEEKIVAVMPIANLGSSAKATVMAENLSFLISDLLRPEQQEITELPLIRRLLNRIGVGDKMVDLPLGFKLGKLLSAEKIVTGILTELDLANHQFQLELTVMDLNTGSLEELDRMVGTEVDIARQIPEQLKPFANPIDENSLTLLDYAIGRQNFDQGKYRQAVRAFDRTNNRSPELRQLQLFREISKVIDANRREANPQADKEIYEKVTASQLEAEFEKTRSTKRAKSEFLDYNNSRLTQNFMRADGDQNIVGNGDGHFPGHDRPISIIIHNRLLQ